ncbi:hypothetical protein [Streptococcus uberis]|uniref:hypothetical protein n=1 Tax=Streptococcus uberis TaxID=1349 RepID=UPI001FF14277|nr:hypothetical protein [Streptococcus uberis]MCK1219567.1 hypothetical protein [Streptococcus uberis]
MITVLKEIKQLLEDILLELKKKKEPTAVTVDSEKIANSLNPNDLTEMAARLNSMSNQLRQ